MQNDKINLLTKKASVLHPSGKPLTKVELQQIEDSLDIVLSYDFKKINEYYNYSYLWYFDFCSFPRGVIEETHYYRKRNDLDQNYLILSNQDEMTVVMKIISTKKSEVIWCGLEDFFNLCENKPMEYNPTIFPSFTDFFEFLLDEEEKMQAEDEEDTS